jgi:hypothetical protein
LTSTDALAAFWNLPKSNPNLYKQFSGKCKDKLTVDSKEEPTFFIGEEIGDDSNISMDVILSQVMEKGLGQGFETNEDGQIKRTGIAEDIDAEIVAAAAPLILGHGKYIKTTSTWYTSAWEHS